MKKLFFPLFAAVLWFACQNSNQQQPAGETQSAAPAAPVNDYSKPLTQVDVLQASAKVKTSVEDLKGFLTDLESVPEANKTANQEHYETMKRLIEENLTKQTAYAKELEAAVAAGNSIPNPDKVWGIIAGVDEFSRHIDGFRSRIEQLKNGQGR